MKKIAKKLFVFLLIVSMLTSMSSPYSLSNIAEANSSVEVDEIDGYTNWTFSEAGIDDGIYNWKTQAATKDGEAFNLNKSAFSGCVSFSVASSSTVHDYGQAPRITLGAAETGGEWSSKTIKFGLQTEGDSTFLSCAISGTVGWMFKDTQVLPGEEILLQVTFDYIDKDSDGASDDLQMRVWINGAEASSVYRYGTWDYVTGEDIYVIDYVDESNPMKSHIMLHGAKDTDQNFIGDVSVRSVEFIKTAKYSANVEEIDGYTNWSFSAADVTDGTYNYSSTAAKKDGEAFSLDQSAFSGCVSFSTSTSNNTTVNNYTAPSLTIGAGSGENPEWDSHTIKFGLMTVTEGDTTSTFLSCAVSSNTEGWIFRDKQIAPDEEILLQVTFDYVDKDSDDASDDLQMHVWINGTEVSNVQTYDGWGTVTAEDICVKDYVDESNPINPHIMLHYGADSTESVTVRSVGFVKQEKTYTDWTFSTANVDDGSYSYKETIANQDGTGMDIKDTKFSGYVDFDASVNSAIAINWSASSISFGGVGNGPWDDQSKLVRFGLWTVNNMNYLACSVGGESTQSWLFLDKTIELNSDVFLQVAFSYIDKDQDGKEDDLQLHVSIDGLAATSVQVGVEPWTMVTGEDICVLDYADDANSVKSYLMLHGGQNENKEIVGNVTVRSIVSNTVKQKDLTYDLADGERGYVLLGSGTIRLDGAEVPVGTTLNTVGDYKIERIHNGATYTRTIHIVDTSQDTLQIPAVTYDVIGGDEVMPILGFYVPHSTTYEKEDGTADISFTADKYYKMLRECGINLLANTNTSESNLPAIREQLRLAQKYNMGMYVTNELLWNMQESEYWNEIAPYGDYDSFLGVYVIDEPAIYDNEGNQRYGSGNDTRGEAYKTTSKIINKYANLTGYINLLPMNTDLQQDTSMNCYLKLYPEYIQKAAIDAGVKIVSYDRYPSYVKLRSNGLYTGADWDQEGTFENGGFVNSALIYQNLSIIREQAMSNNLPFWTFVENGDFSDAEDNGYRQIEREEILWYVNTALAYGTKGIEYFSAVEEDTTTDIGNDGAAEHGLIDCQGNKTKWYAYAQEANQHIASVDHVLMKSINQGVVAAGEGSYVETAASQFSGYLSDASAYNLKSVETEDTTYGALTGVFGYYPDKAKSPYNAYYVVNSNPTAKQTISLNFVNATTYSVIQDTETTYVGQASDKCQVTILPGEAVLIVANYDLSETENHTQVVYYEDIAPYRVDNVLGKVDKRAPEMQEDTTYTDWTFNAADIASTAHGYINNPAYMNGQQFGLDGTRFSGYIKFSSAADNTKVHNYLAPVVTIGAVNGDVWNNYPIIFGLRTVNEGGVVSTFLSCSDTAGTAWIFRDKQVMPNEEIFLQVTFDYVGSDLQMHVWIDGTPVSSVQECTNWGMVTGEDLVIPNYVDVSNPVMSNIMLHYGASNTERVTVRSADPSKGMEDYIFAGWYTDVACTTPLAEEVISGAAYAKFVDADVLSVKTQLNLEHTAMRFVSTVDTLSYKQVGFDIRCNKTNKETCSKEVYDQIYAVGDNSEIMEYHPTVFSMFSQHFFAYTVSGLTSDAAKIAPFIVSPYWITLDGTKVSGESISYSINEAIVAVAEATE